MKTKIIAICFMLTTLSNAQVQNAEKVWIDTDIAIGKLGRDVDDGIALIMALKSDELEIVGISLVRWPNYGYKVTQKLLGWYNNGPQIPVYRGVTSTDIRTYHQNEAVEAMAEALRKHEMTILALGPVSNIALMLQRYPELAPRIKNIVWCAGRQPNQKFAPGNGKVNVCDCNFEEDPEAAQILISSGVNISLASYEPASNIYLSKTDIAPLRKSDNKGDRWLYKQLSKWLKIWRVSIGSKEGFIPFDAITLGSFIREDYMQKYENIPVQIYKLKNDSWLWSLKKVKPYLLVSESFKGSHKVDYFYHTDKEYKQFILDYLLTASPPSKGEITMLDINRR
ncbi:nucleoside hydrolase [Maribacter sp. MJ134]|uniref:nucleoside hydrolase n=1 Tax=Maribacter sp. MJ134 TaxID=2496865 RepID=UPI000F81F781|nr:nucleoside hydrolase [Maribacter sp. MJ134]AZQ59349.1 nucleoside hydrolase [Maribacter sp. MJ134]